MQNAELRLIEMQDLQTRTKKFSLRIIRLCQALPNGFVSRRIGDQLVRSGMSVGANYRAACRARSSAEFIAKMGIVEVEADETIYWMELLIESEIMKGPDLQPLMKEANEIVAMIVASIRTARGNMK
jgi:four helix bundle protein